MKDSRHGGFSTALWSMVLGVLLGGIAALTISPRIIVWYFRPPAQMGFSCSEPIQWALSRMQFVGWSGGIIGGVLGIMTYFAFFRRRPGDRSPSGTGAPAPAR